VSEPPIGLHTPCNVGNIGYGHHVLIIKSHDVLLVGEVGRKTSKAWSKNPNWPEFEMLGAIAA